MNLAKLIPESWRHRTMFYRHHSPSELRWAKVSFSQFGEDAFLDAYFARKKSGFYVDVGAFHPIKFSNTYLFYRRGWNGINIEPNPAKLGLFHKHRSHDTNLGLAVSESPGRASFIVEGIYSRIADSNETGPRNPKARVIEVETQPLGAILEKHLPAPDHPIDILSVDCEGHDRIVLDSNDWNRFRPRVIVCEDLELKSGPGAKTASGINSLLTSLGYEVRFRMAYSLIYFRMD